MRSAAFGILATSCLVAACASGHTTQPASGVTPAVRAAATPEGSGGQVFTTDQLSRSAAANVYDALQQLQPDVLTGHGRGEPDVYVDRVKQTSGLSRLRELSLNAVTDVTYLRADQAKAQNLSDSQSIGGAIVVRLR